MSSLSAMSRRAVIGAQIDKLAEYDASLTDIAAEMTALRDELGRLRAEAARLTELLAERDTAVSRLEREHGDASREAHAAALSFRKSEARLEVSREQVSTLLRQQHALLARLDEAERRLTEAADTQRRLRAGLAERERTIEELREEVRRTAGERAAWEARSTALARELDLATAERGHPPLPPSPADEGRPEDAAASSTRHLRVLCLPSGYRLGESHGPCPQPGDVVDVDGTRFLVIRIGESPLPLDPRACAFLVPRSDEPGD